MIQDFIIIDKEIVLKDVLFKAIESNGYSESNDWALFRIGEDKELLVNYDISLLGVIDEEDEGYWTPPSCELVLTSMDIYIDSIFINDEEVNLDYFSDDSLEKLRKTIMDLYY